MNLFQINSVQVGGEYAAPLLLGISKRSLLEGQASTPAYAAYTGWHADTMFSLVPSKTQVRYRYNALYPFLKDGLGSDLPVLCDHAWR